jgi:hypothetical protein
MPEHANISKDCDFICTVQCEVDRELVIRKPVLLVHESEKVVNLQHGKPR